MKRFLSLLLVILFVVSVVPICALADNSVKVSTTFEFGTYPQSEVTDSSLIAALNGVDASWISYGYYISGSSSDYMKYKDVTYNEEKYRAVTFSSYRPYDTTLSSSEANSYQDNNGYNVNNVYWFKYEPLKWKVLDPSTGLCMCASIIDCRDFYYTSYSGTQTRGGEEAFANSYKYSNIRAFLKNDFYNIAFTKSERAQISGTAVNGNDYTSTYSSGNGDTTDRIFLLSTSDVENSSYGFDSNTSRYMQGTDYAKCQGLWVSKSGSYSGNGGWWLRSAGYGGYCAFYVNYYGNVSDSYSNVYIANYGVVPAMTLKNLSSLIGGGQSEETPTLPFDDVKEGSWYYNGVVYCYEHGYMSGTSATTFAPNMQLSRAQIVQILANMSGDDLSVYKDIQSFTDVAKGKWYHNAIEWAKAKGVTSGTSDTTFSPDGALTREQLAVLLYNYAALLGKDVTGRADMSKYTDASAISKWASSQVSWAVSAGLISGTTATTVSPKAVATRAQAAVIIMNFDKNVLGH